jgi:eukaryotic-like serine/threonine-protein kinase
MNARIEELFHSVADLTADSRTKYFAEHAVDQATRQEVETLLAFDSGAISFLERDISIAASLALPQLDPSGWLCGPYRLLEVIGRGGMGAVYLAERADGEVTQQVAVKLLPPGAGAMQRERFLQERQILASLAHPNIARMLGAGHVENGQPFLAMEFVEGKPIDIFSAGLSIRQKVSLFLKVCAAVSYLHRNLIVHREWAMLGDGSAQKQEPDSGIDILDESIEAAQRHWKASAGIYRDVADQHEQGNDGMVDGRRPF